MHLTSLSTLSRATDFKPTNEDKFNYLIDGSLGFDDENHIFSDEKKHERESFILSREWTFPVTLEVLPKVCSPSRKCTKVKRKSHGHCIDSVMCAYFQRSRELSGKLALTWRDCSRRSCRFEHFSAPKRVSTSLRILRSLVIRAVGSAGAERRKSVQASVAYKYISNHRV